MCQQREENSSFIGLLTLKRHSIYKQTVESMFTVTTEYTILNTIT